MRILSIFRNDFRRLLKDVGLMIGLLVMPLAMIVPAVLTYEVDEEGDEISGTPVIVVNYDQGEITAAVREHSLRRKRRVGSPQHSK